MRSALWLLPLLALLAAAGHAEADPLGGGASANPVALEGHLGIATPLGFGGVSLSGNFSDQFAGDVGIGLGLAGPQVAANGRFRLSAPDGLAPYVAVGLSGGAYTWNEFVFDSPASKHADLAFWANGQIGIEHQRAGGFTLRVYGGYGRVLNPDALVCVEEVDHCEASHRGDGLGLPFFGASLGHFL
jgi:hypothetical protein